MSKRLTQAGLDQIERRLRLLEEAIPSEGRKQKIRQFVLTMFKSVPRSPKRKLNKEQKAVLADLRNRVDVLFEQVERLRVAVFGDDIKPLNPEDVLNRITDHICIRARQSIRGRL